MLYIKYIENERYNLMAYEHKISDLKYRINGLVPKNICQKLIEVFEKYPELYLTEESYKYETDKREVDNFQCINLSRTLNPNEDIKWALETASQFINIMIANYVLYIKAKGICPSFTDHNLNASQNVRILRYEEGQYIKDHTDVDWRTRGSCTLNLNEDYEGGDFTFFNGRIKESYKTGDAMIFPAEPIWIHGTDPITKGTRYAINCFLHSKHDGFPK